jgi:HAD superfamily hydrolase (TIGR01509 family)
VEPICGALELLQAVKHRGIERVIVTGSGQKSLLERLEKNFPGIFKAELMVTAFDVKHGKPHPEPYLMGLEKAGISAEEAVVVENAPLGVQAAKAAGIFTIAVNTGPLPDKVLYDAGADIVFPNHCALLEALPVLLV